MATKKTTGATATEPMTSQSKAKRRVIGVTADKGGTGKSTISRLTADVLIQLNIPTLAFDCDMANPQLHRYYNNLFSSAFNSGTGVQHLNLGMKGGADELINSLDSENTKVILIDFPAGGNALLDKLEREVGLFEVLEEVGYRLTFMSVLSRVKDSINSLRTLLEYCGDRADHVVVKNGFYGSPEKFRRFDNSKTKTLLEEMGGIVINFPDLYDDTFDLLDDKNMPFSEALKPESGLSLADRRQVKVFRDEAESELLKAAEYLGLQ